jgi:peptidyl-dipeptidase Dcp
MNRPFRLRHLPVLPLVLLAIQPGSASPAPASPMSANPLLSPSPLPYQLPPFEFIKDEHFQPAFEQGMAESLREIDAITSNPAAPTFDNTIVATRRWTGSTRSWPRVSRRTPMPST